MPGFLQRHFPRLSVFLKPGLLALLIAGCATAGIGLMKNGIGAVLILLKINDMTINGIREPSA